MRYANKTNKESRRLWKTAVIEQNLPWGHQKHGCRLLFWEDQHQGGHGRVSCCLQVQLSNPPQLPNNTHTYFKINLHKNPANGGCHSRWKRDSERYSMHMLIYLNIALILAVHFKQVQDTTSQKQSSTVSWMHYQQVLKKIGTQSTERKT